MAQIFDSEIARYASEHKISYRDAWRALINSKGEKSEDRKTYGERLQTDVKTAFCIGEGVIVPGGNRGKVVEAYKAKSWVNPKYSVMMETGHVRTYSEEELKPLK